LTIRLTDDGELALRSELADITYAVRNFNDGPILNVWYIHGWKHSAEGADSDLLSFRKLITALQQLQDKVPVEARRHVVLDDALLRPLADEPIHFAQSPAGSRPVHFHRSTLELDSLLT